jgi:hypothetical protein
MTFAVHKLYARQGKATIFKIRGQKRSATDIERFWKRKKTRPAPASVCPATPEGLTYHTPSPAPAGSTPQDAGSDTTDIEDEINRDCDDFFALRTDLAAFSPGQGIHHDFFQSKTSQYHRSTSMAPIPGSTTSIVAMSSPQEGVDWEGFLTSAASTSTPVFGTSGMKFVSDITNKDEPSAKNSNDHIMTRFGHRPVHLSDVRRHRLSASPSPTASGLLNFSDTDRLKYEALNEMKVYHICFVESGCPQLASEGRRTVGQFHNASLDALLLLKHGQFPSVAEAKLEECIKFAPRMMQLDSPRMMVVALSQIAMWNLESIRAGLHSLESNRQKLLFSLISAADISHPLWKLLIAVREFGRESGSLVQLLLRCGNDVLIKNNDGTDVETRYVKEARAALSIHMLDWEDARQASQYACEVHEKKYAAYPTEENMYRLLYNQERLAHCHFALGNYALAETLITNGLRACGELVEVINERYMRSRFLYNRALLEVCRGDWYGARSSLSEALTLAVASYGAGDSWATACAWQLRWVEDKIAEREERTLNALQHRQGPLYS